MERHEQGIETLHAPAASLEHWLEEIEVSVAEGRTLHMDYRNGNGTKSSSRSIDPYGLVLWKGQWYTVAHCHLRGDIRSFRVDRITGLYRTGATFVRPEDSPHATSCCESLLPAKDPEERLITLVIESSEEAILERSYAVIGSSGILWSSVQHGQVPGSCWMKPHYTPTCLISFCHMENRWHIVAPASFKHTAVGSRLRSLASHYAP
jgi:hypothetical protein